MTPSWRKPFGMLLILLLIAAWAVLVTTLVPLFGRPPALVEALLYVAGGIVWIWVLPMRRLLTWMETGRW
ncbi:DUF2842 domain-containing protein [Sphingomonas sp. 1P06PA]|uniref:DUF2842 domain-containing protein n=1 Tax=Sphingomonas sp. 1P06PA TaxID=554121 RepID=UPI0039A4C7EB